MPIYEYECPQCGCFEQMQRITAEPLTECPKCAEKGKSNPVKKLISLSAFHLKGSGWYKTDYASNGSTGSISNGSSASSNSTSTSDAKESKKDTTSDSKGKTDSKETKPKSPAKALSDAGVKD